MSQKLSCATSTNNDKQQKKGYNSISGANPTSPSSPSTQANDTSPLLQGDISDFLTQDYLCEQISILKSEIIKPLEIQKNEIIEHLKKENDLLKAEISELKQNANQKELKIVDIERDVINLQQLYAETILNYVAFLRQH